MHNSANALSNPSLFHPLNTLPSSKTCSGYLKKYIVKTTKSLNKDVIVELASYAFLFLTTYTILLTSTFFVHSIASQGPFIDVTTHVKFLGISAVFTTIVNLANKYAHRDAYELLDSQESVSQTFPLEDNQPADHILKANFYRGGWKCIIQGKVYEGEAEDANASKATEKCLDFCNSHNIDATKILNATVKRGFATSTWLIPAIQTYFNLVELERKNIFVVIKNDPEISEVFFELQHPGLAVFSAKVFFSLMKSGNFEMDSVPIQTLHIYNPETDRAEVFMTKKSIKEVQKAIAKY